MASLRGEMTPVKPDLPFPVQEPQKDTHYAVAEAVSQLSRCARSQQLAHDQAQVERADMDQLPLQNVAVPAQVCAPHAAGFVAMREAAFDQFTAPPQQALAVLPRTRRRFAYTACCSSALPCQLRRPVCFFSGM